ncbi:hypothetical protein D3C78_1257590 [compost metagenome]
MPGQETLADAFLIEACCQLVPQDRQRHLIGIARRQPELEQPVPLPLYQCQHHFRFAVLLKKGLKQLTTQWLPLWQRARLPQTLPPTTQRCQQFRQLPGQFCHQPARLVIRQNALPITGIAVHRVTQQHACNAKLPGMLAGSGQIQFTHVVVIQPPAHARLTNPMAQQAQSFLPNGETCRQCRNFQQSQYLF